MRKAPMQEHICDELVDMEFTCQEEVQPQHSRQVNTTAFKHKSSNECQDIHYQQILGHCGYIVHLCIYFLPIYHLNDIQQFLAIRVQNYEKYPF